MTPASDANFKHNYQTHLKHLKLKGLQPKTIEAYSRAIRRIGAYFEYQINDLSEQQLTDYFSDLLDSHSLYVPSSSICMVLNSSTRMCCISPGPTLI